MASSSLHVRGRSRLAMMHQLSPTCSGYKSSEDNKIIITARVLTRFRPNLLRSNPDITIQQSIDGLHAAETMVTKNFSKVERKDVFKKDSGSQKVVANKVAFH